MGSEQVHGQKEAALARVKTVEKQKQDMATQNEELRWALQALPLPLTCRKAGHDACASSTLTLHRDLLSEVAHPLTALRHSTCKAWDYAEPYNRLVTPLQSSSEGQRQGAGGAAGHSAAAREA